MSLFKLPAELRNQIYELALPQTATISLSGIASTPTLLQVNRQIRSEAISLYHPTKVVAIIKDTATDGPMTWLSSRTKTANATIESFTFECYIDEATVTDFVEFIEKDGLGSAEGLDQEDVFESYVFERDDIPRDMGRLTDSVVQAGVAATWIKACAPLSAKETTSEECRKGLQHEMVKSIEDANFWWLFEFFYGVSGRD